MSESKEDKIERLAQYGIDSANSHGRITKPGWVDLRRDSDSNLVSIFYGIAAMVVEAKETP